MPTIAVAMDTRYQELAMNAARDVRRGLPAMPSHSQGRAGFPVAYAGQPPSPGNLQATSLSTIESSDELERYRSGKVRRTHRFASTQTRAPNAGEALRPAIPAAFVGIESIDRNRATLSGNAFADPNDPSAHLLPAALPTFGRAHARARIWNRGTCVRARGSATRGARETCSGFTYFHGAD